MSFKFWVLGNPGVSVGYLCATEGTRYDGFPIESGMTKGEGTLLSLIKVPDNYTARFWSLPS